MGAMYYGPARDAAVWDEIVSSAREHFNGEVILGQDALVLEVGQK
jgi:hypothetical protein